MNFNHFPQRPVKLTVATVLATVTCAMALPVIEAIATPAQPTSASPADEQTLEKKKKPKDEPADWCEYIPRPYRRYVPGC